MGRDKKKILMHKDLIFKNEKLESVAVVEQLMATKQKELFIDTSIKVDIKFML